MNARLVHCKNDPSNFSDIWAHMSLNWPLGPYLFIPRKIPAVGVADRGKHSNQSTTMSSGTSALLPFNTEQHALAAFPKTGIQKTSFKYRYPHVACHCHLRFISTLVSTLRNLLNLHLSDPKVDDFPFSVQSTILYALLRLTCYAFFSHARSVVHCQQD